MAEDYANAQQGGGGAAGVWLLFLSRGAGRAALRIRDLGGHSMNGKGPGGGSGPGGKTSDGMARADETGEDVNIYLGGESKGGGGVPDDGGLHPEAPEHSPTVHRCTITFRPV